MYLVSKEHVVRVGLKVSELIAKTASQKMYFYFRNCLWNGVLLTFSFGFLLAI